MRVLFYCECRRCHYIAEHFLIARGCRCDVLNTECECMLCLNEQLADAQCRN